MASQSFRDILNDLLEETPDTTVEASSPVSSRRSEPWFSLAQSFFRGKTGFDVYKRQTSPSKKGPSPRMEAPLRTESRSSSPSKKQVFYEWKQLNPQAETALKHLYEWSGKPMPSIFLEKDVRRLYWGLAQKFHPDHHPENPSAKEAFVKIQKAHETVIKAIRSIKSV